MPSVGHVPHSATLQEVQEALLGENPQERVLRARLLATPDNEDMVATQLLEHLVFKNVKGKKMFHLPKKN